MLVILYGLISKMGDECRTYFKEAGFHKVEKFYYAKSPKLTSTYGTRKYVSKKEFLANTDPLFRYAVGGIDVGYNREHIAQAVAAETNSFMTLSTDDISFLREIRRIYAEQVHIVYVYIDERVLREIVESDNKSPEEREERLAIGWQVKRRYLENQDLFDDVLLYSGEGTQFDISSLKTQVDSIIRRCAPVQEAAVQYADVVIPCAPEDNDVYEELREWMEVNGVSVYDNTQLGDNPIQRAIRMEDAIHNAKMVVPLFSKAFRHSEGIHRKLVIDIIRAYGKQAVAVELDAEPGAHDLWCTDVCKVRMRTWIEDIEYAAGVVCHILDMESQLQRYAEQVESYVKLGMFEDARRVQEQHYAVCEELGDRNMLLGSTDKLAEIYVMLHRYQDAMERIAIAIGTLGCQPALVRWLILCGQRRNMDEAALAAWLTEQTDYMSDAYQAQILETFTATVEKITHSAEAPRVIATLDETEIATCGERALELFEGVVATTPTLSRQDLIDGYRRILDYCQQVGLGGRVPDTCMKRIDDLRRKAGNKGETSTASTTALKVYLGKAYPQSGYYDAFISYKSENEVLAREVYEFLVKSGKEVFFAPVTLNNIGNSDYTEEIMKAIHHSAHMVLVSDHPAYLSTDWVKKEWEAFLKKGTGNLLIVLKGGSSKENVDGLPQILSQKQILKLSDYQKHILTYLSKS